MCGTCLPDLVQGEDGAEGRASGAVGGCRDEIGNCKEKIPEACFGMDAGVAWYDDSDGNLEIAEILNR